MTTFAHNPIVKTLGQSANSTQPNYQLHMEVRMQATEGSGTFDKVLAQQLEPNTAGIATFYLQEAFRAGFAMHLPTLTGTATAVATGIHRTAEVYAGEVYGNTPTLQNVTLNDTLTLINGGLTLRKFKAIDYFTTYQANGSANKKFLTWHPAGKKVVHPTAPEFLYYLANSSVATINIIVTAYFTDGTSSSTSTAYATGISSGINILAIPAGYTSAGVSTINPAKTVLKYDISLQDDADDTAISETRTYYPDLQQHPYTRQFAFQNSLGATDFVRTYGKATTTDRYARSTAQATLDSTYTATTPQQMVATRSRQQEVSISTGFVNRATAEYYAELFVSRQVYEIISGAYVPIVVTTGSHRIQQDGTDKWFARFSYTYAYTDKHFTPESI